MSKILDFIKSLPEHELDELDVEVWSSSENKMQILSVYLSDNGKSLVIDISNIRK